MTLKELRQKRQGRHGADWPRRRGSKGRARPWWRRQQQMPTERPARLPIFHPAACRSSCCRGEHAVVWGQS